MNEKGISVNAASPGSRNLSHSCPASADKGRRRRMISESELATKTPNSFRLSGVWDVYVPITIAIVPAGIFLLLGLVTDGLDKPGAEPAAWLLVTMAVLQTLGIIAMAVVVLIRYEVSLQQLLLRTDGYPPIWRKLVLRLAIVFILLFDLLTNLAAALAGAGPLVFLAIPAFIAYLFCIRIAFAGL